MKFFADYLFDIAAENHTLSHTENPIPAQLLRKGRYPSAPDLGTSSCEDRIEARISRYGWLVADHCVCSWSL